jgi:large subunit ribosomal protein L21
MTYAIIEASGKQFRVEAGRFYDLDRLPVDEEGTVTIDRVLFISHEGDMMVGQPLVEGATVSGTVIRHLRGRKIIVYKMKPKKKTRKKRGHRQELTRLMIDAISVNGKVLVGAVTATTTSSRTDTVGEAEETTEVISASAIAEAPVADTAAAEVVSSKATPAEASQAEAEPAQTEEE